MQKFVSALVVVLFATAPAWGQFVPPPKTLPPPVPATITPSADISTPATVVPAVVTQPVVTTAPGELKATPEMWFYEQTMKEYKDPKNAVRANAEFAGKQRAARLASMKWFGLSNARPRVCADQVNNYPPAWGSNTPLQPNRWQATGGQPYYVARPDTSELR
jgi:hypothetical protein